MCWNVWHYLATYVDITINFTIIVSDSLLVSVFVLILVCTLSIYCIICGLNEKITPCSKSNMDAMKFLKEKTTLNATDL